MKLEERCLREFDSVIRARGEDDFRARHLNLESVTASEAKFRFQGVEPVAVQIGWAELRQTGLLQAHCSCKAFSTGEKCQHVWSALLELDRRGQGAMLATAASLKIVPVTLETALTTVVPAESPPLSGWRALLFQLAKKPKFSATSESMDASSSRLALYVLSFDQTRQAGCLSIEMRYHERIKSGEWGSPRIGRFDFQSIDDFGLQEDRELLALLFSPLNKLVAGKRGPKFPDQVMEVDPILMPTVLPKLVESGRFVPGPDQPAFVMGEGEWEFEIDVKEDKGGFRLDGILRRERERIQLRDSDEVAILRAGLFIRGNKIERVEWGSNFELARRLSSETVIVKKADEVDFVTSIAADSDLPTFKLPQALQWPFAEASPQAHARFQRTEAGQNTFSFVAMFDYAGVEIDLSTSRKVLLDPVKRVRIKRDVKGEKAFLKDLKGPHALARLSSEVLKAGDVPDLIHMLQQNGWRVDYDGIRVAPLKGTEGLLKAFGQDFSLEVGFDFESEKLGLGAFFSACAKGERFMRLKDGRIGFLPDAWINRIDLLLRGANLEKDGLLSFKRSSLPLFRPVFEDIQGLRIDEEAGKVFAGLEKLLAPGAAEKPRELRANLRSYQSDGLGWLESVAASGFGGILADDMGLGKTIQIISYLLRRATVPRTGPRPSLVVLPKSLVFNWLGEIEKFGPRLRVLDFAAANRGMLKANDYDVVVTTYHVLKNELDRFEKFEFDTIILDEAQAIKNPGSQIAQAVYRLRGNHRFALSGTPIENSLADLFSLMRFTNPGLIPAAMMASMGEGKAGSLPKNALERLSIALKPFILRRTKKQVLTELPDKTEQALICELESEQKKLYDQLRRQYRDSLKKEIAEKGDGGPKIQVLEALLRLRQACCHPGLVDENLASKPSAKFTMLLEHLEDIRSSGNKALVFSQFTSFLALLKPHLEKAGIRYEYLDGQTRDRGAVVERFNSNPETTVFLISLKAGGTGLNLTTASYVFLMDPWWNPAIEAQAIDRAYRMGQKQKVMAYRLIAQGTIEEKIMRLQAQKRSLAEAVINEDQSFLRSLSADDLASLFD